MRLFTALIPLRVQWYGLATVLLADDPELLELAGRSGPCMEIGDGERGEDRSAQVICDMTGIGVATR